MTTVTDERPARNRSRREISKREDSPQEGVAPRTFATGDGKRLGRAMSPGAALGDPMAWLPKVRPDRIVNHSVYAQRSPCRDLTTVTGSNGIR